MRGWSGSRTARRLCDIVPQRKIARDRSRDSKKPPADEVTRRLHFWKCALQDSERFGRVGEHLDRPIDLIVRMGGRDGRPQAGHPLRNRRGDDR